MSSPCGQNLLHLMQGVFLQSISCITWDLEDQTGAVNVSYWLNTVHCMCTYTRACISLRKGTPVYVLLGWHCLNKQISKVSDYGRMVLKEIIRDFFLPLFYLLVIASGISWQKHREKRELQRWNQIRQRQISLKLLLSSPAAPFEHQSFISICLTDTSY